MDLLVPMRGLVGCTGELMSRATWDETWMKVAWVISMRSGCHRDQVGAVLISSDQRVLATGYNGQPSGYPEDCISCPRHLADGEGLSDSYSDCTSVHAEANCLLYSDSSRRAGATLFITRAPCWGCCKIIANSGIQSVVLPHPIVVDPRVQAYLATCGLRVRRV